MNEGFTSEARDETAKPVLVLNPLTGEYEVAVEEIAVTTEGETAADGTVTIH